jgi:HSP20 family protein
MFFDEFDRLQDSINSVLGEFGHRRGLGGRQQQRGGRGRGGWMDPMSSMWDEEFGEWGPTPLLTAGGQPIKGGQQTLLGKAPEETKMDESTGGQQLMQQQGGQQVGGLQLPTLRCRCNVEDLKDKLVVTAEVPGFDKQNLKVHIDDNNILTICGEQKQEHVEEAKNKKFLRVERSFGQVQRSLKLPRNIDRNKVAAQYQNGILHINVPKVEEKQNQTPVKIQ